jgi:hypothetical protein
LKKRKTDIRKDRNAAVKKRFFVVRMVEARLLVAVGCEVVIVVGSS